MLPILTYFSVILTVYYTMFPSTSEGRMVLIKMLWSKNKCDW